MMGEDTAGMIVFGFIIGALAGFFMITISALAGFHMVAAGVNWFKDITRLCKRRIVPADAYRFTACEKMVPELRSIILRTWGNRFYDYVNVRTSILTEAMLNNPMRVTSLWVAYACNRKRCKVRALDRDMPVGSELYASEGLHPRYLIARAVQGEELSVTIYDLNDTDLHTYHYDHLREAAETVMDMGQAKEASA